MENIIPADLGLAEFVAKLVEETLEAVIASQASQLKRQTEIIDAALLTAQGFADLYIHAEQVNEQLTEFFPACNIAVDQPFNKTQWSATLESIGIELFLEEDLKHDNSEQSRLTVSGVFKIQNAVKLFLALEKQKILQSLITKGIPRLEVDSGEITAKVNFNTTKTDQVSTVNQRSMNPSASEKYELLAKPLAGNSILTRKIDSQTLPNVKVFVNQVNNSSSSSANGCGEVKIRFRTVW